VKELPPKIILSARFWTDSRLSANLAFVETCLKLFQNYFTGLLQLVKKIFQHVCCRWNNFVSCRVNICVFYRTSICDGGLGNRNSVCLSVCPSVRLFVTRVDCDKLNGALQIFWYHTKGQLFCYSNTNSGWWATPLPSEICTQNYPPPSRNADFNSFPRIMSQP